MRITAVCAGLGLAVGGVLFAVLRFVVGHVVVGQGVLDGVPLTDPAGLTVRYADYLPTDGGSASLRLLPVALGAGLVTGLLLGTVGRVVAAHRAAGVGRVLGPVVLSGAGLVVGAVLAVELHVYGAHGGVDLAGGPFGDQVYGWYSYTPLSNASPSADGIFYGGGPGRGSGSWWPLLGTGAAVGVVVGALAAAVVLLVARLRRA